MKEKARQKNLLENLAVVILAFYPLRHINWGLDLWDTGYNYSNFQYMGLEHMDPMWLFSTYLSTAVGNLLMKLPSAGSLMGMNFYTGLLVSLLALAGYFFCTRTLKIPRWIAFAGEFTAVSLCWCPTAVLYNYLTYVFFLFCVILLYSGLTRERPLCLVLAGVCLGANVLVRFSNLPEAALILSVWFYDGIVWHQQKKNRRLAGESLWRRLGQHTLWCFAGYGSALLTLLGYIHIRYGFGNYAVGIRRLFAMTDNASDYTAKAMLMGMIGEYVENLYWAFRFGIILAGGIILFAITDKLLEKSEGAKAGPVLQKNRGTDTGSGIQKSGEADTGSGPALQKNGGTGSGPVLQKNGGTGSGPVLQKNGTKMVLWGARALWAAVCAAVPVWLYLRGAYSMEFLHSGPIQYGPMQRPGTFFLMLTLLICVIRLMHPDSPAEEKLISSLLLLVVLLTPLGSNNRLMPALNNLFLAAPYTLWQSWRFCRNVATRHIGRLTLNPFPAKSLLLTFLLMCTFLFAGFGVRFSFAEATGVYNLTATVENNAILRNIKMSPEKAKWLTELSQCVEDRGLQGREVIPYGWIPSVAYYLQMPPAFNPWSDLASYSQDAMAAAMADTENGIREDSADKPVVIVNYLQKNLAEDQKWQLILDFMDRNGYELVWQNDAFAVYE